jgi:putative CocE/NonD family hydrolase
VENGSLSYVYSPADPYPSHGGTALGDGVGPARQNENITREDQLVFESRITGEPLILLGPVTATLWLSSDAPCTDFVVGLQDVFPDGRIINIQEGGARVEPDRDNPEKTIISVWATGYQLNAGHTLRVFIASSWFPRYNRNLNLCQPAGSATRMADARQKVYYGTGTPSSIDLPVYQIQKNKRH